MVHCILVQMFLHRLAASVKFVLLNINGKSYVIMYIRLWFLS